MANEREQEDIKAFLSKQSLFEDMAEYDLDTLASMASIRSLANDETLFEEGETGNAMFVVIDGSLEITKRIDSRIDVLAVRGPGDVIGEMSVLNAAPRSATATARGGARLVELDQDAFRTLMACSGSAAMNIVQTMARRLRSTEAALQQHQKLASLGTMAAGLAHELNNPAAAVSRSVQHLGEALDAASDALLDFVAAAPEAGDLAVLCAHRETLLAARAAAGSGRSGDLPGGGAGHASAGVGSAESDPAGTAGTAIPPEPGPYADDPFAREEALRSALERLGVPQAWELAATFGDAGVQPSELAAMLEELPPAGRAAGARFLAVSLDARALLGDTAVAAHAISRIVDAVKRYSYLDQAPLQQVDLHAGLDDTLVILRHKWKQGVSIVREYDPAVPRLEAYGSELNQVWTNLIDNALDAMEGRGTLRIRTQAGPQRVAVEICDDGPGIPDELAAKIFDPFFTTKPLGKGTGLGLHTVHRIVERHRGSVRMRRGERGGTCACVTLPLTPADASG